MACELCRSRAVAFAAFGLLALSLSGVTWKRSQNALQHERFQSQPRPVCTRKLVLHVGLHKTGTTSLQVWMGTHRKWLAARLGVLAAREAAHCVAWKFKMGVPVASRPGRVQTLCSRYSVEEAFDFLSAAMANLRAHVIISSEVFSSLEPDEWKLFLGYLHNKTVNLPCFVVSPLVLLRVPSSWSHSQWITQNKKLTNPKPSADWLAGEAPEAELHRLRTLVDVFGRSAVNVVSYESLVGANHTLQSFLICNATLGKVGESWSECQSLVDSKEMLRLNISPAPEALDVVRLARHMFNIYSVAPESSCNFTLNSLNSQVGPVAAQMPRRCNTLHERFAKLEDALYNLSGLARPQHEHQWCGVSETQLQPEHWKLIRGLLPKCLKAPRV